jgi:hypothetical protein
MVPFWLKKTQKFCMKLSAGNVICYCGITKAHL